MHKFFAELMRSALPAATMYCMLVFHNSVFGAAFMAGDMWRVSFDQFLNMPPSSTRDKKVSTTNFNLLPKIQHCRCQEVSAIMTEIL
jgi:hypothetical protein